MPYWGKRISKCPGSPSAVGSSEAGPGTSPASHRHESEPQAPGRSGCQGLDRSQPETARNGLCQPLLHPLAERGNPDRRDHIRAQQAQRSGADPGHRRLQLLSGTSEGGRTSGKKNSRDSRRGLLGTNRGVRQIYAMRIKLENSILYEQDSRIKAGSRWRGGEA